jgi:hypothetical protein
MMNSIKPQITIRNNAYVDRNILQPNGKKIPVLRTPPYTGEQKLPLGTTGGIAVQNRINLNQITPDGKTLQYSVPESVVRKYIEGNQTDGNLYIQVNGNAKTMPNQKGKSERIDFGVQGIHDYAGTLGAGSTELNLTDYVDPSDRNTQTFRIRTRPNSGKDITDQILNDKETQRGVLLPNNQQPIPPMPSPPPSENPSFSIYGDAPDLNLPPLP